MLSGEETDWLSGVSSFDEEKLHIAAEKVIRQAKYRRLARYTASPLIGIAIGVIATLYFMLT